MHESTDLHVWLEPFKEWIQTAQILGKIAQHGSPKERKAVTVKVYGSNLFLDSKKARGDALKPWSLLLEQPLDGGMVPQSEPYLELGIDC